MPIHMNNGERHKEMRMNGAFPQLVQMLSVAASRVTQEYFQLPVANADSVYRERVYCYELYHQLRCIWDEFGFSLGGEVDKAGHPHFRNGPYAGAKPDLLVHVPGQMDQNLAAVEVKPATASVEELRHDLHKLTWFCQRARYLKGVLLIYGDGGETESVRAKLQGAVDNEVDLPVLISLYHREVGHCPEPITVAIPPTQP